MSLWHRVELLKLNKIIHFYHDSGNVFFLIEVCFHLACFGENYKFVFVKTRFF